VSERQANGFVLIDWSRRREPRWRDYQQPTSTALVTLPRLRWMDGEPLPPGTRLGPIFKVDEGDDNQ